MTGNTVRFATRNQNLNKGQVTLSVKTKIKKFNLKMVKHPANSDSLITKIEI